MKRVLLLIFQLLFAASSIAYITAIAAPYISPKLSGYIAIPGFFFLWFFVLQFVWVLFWFKAHTPMLKYALVIFALGVYNASFHFSILPLKANETTGVTNLSVMSWNVKNFDLYNWANNTTIKDNMLKVITDEDPDVLVLQEFYTDRSADFNTLSALAKLYPYNQFRKTLTLDKSKYWGVAIFSKYPLVNKQFIRFSNSRHNQAVIADLVLSTDTVTLYNVHLQSIHFDAEDYENIETVTEGNFSQLSYKTILSKLASASQKRAHQADTILQHIEQNPYPIILCGDFNDSPNSYTYHTLSKQLNDAFLKAGWGLGRTYDGPIPSLRIDYVLHDPALVATNFSVIKTQALSDHYPVKAKFTLP